MKGFSLYQNTSLDYPLAVPSGPEAIVQGTLLQWPVEGAFAEALQRCNHIESYRHKQGGGLYCRKVVDAECAHGELVKAYMYYQNKSIDQLVGFKEFPQGDWLE